jgi:hypothetical protein
VWPSWRFFLGGNLEQAINIAAIMSCPRVGWNDSWGVAVEALRPFGIPIFIRSQAFWGHCLQELMEGRVDGGCDWILTLDYDSMFTSRDVQGLIGRVVTYPSIDALAAFQCRRGSDETPLMGIDGAKQVEVGNEPVPVTTAHFGLTLVRCDALRKLPKPWFHQKPDSKGSWNGDDRTDPDIWFWNRWTENGFMVCVDPCVSIGHLQLMVSEFGPDRQPRHVHVEQWRKTNLGV